MNSKFTIILIMSLLVISDIYSQELESIKNENNSNSTEIKNNYISELNATVSNKNSDTEETTEVQTTPKFNIKEFRIKGNTLLDKKIIETTVYGFLGENKTLNDIETVRMLLEQTYKISGFPAISVSIPEQSTRNGIVTLKVVEGKISRVKITGSKYHSLNEIRLKIPALSRNNVLYLPDVQKQLNTLNQSDPDRKITPVLKPGRYPGTIEVELKVKDEFPVHGDLELNNRYTSTTTKSRLSASFRYDNLFQKQHSLGISYQITPEKTNEVKVASLTYIMPIGSGTDRLVIYGIKSNSNVSTLGDVTVIGNGQILGARWIKPLTGTKSYFHGFSGGFDYKDFEDTQEVSGIDLFYPISYWSSTINYNSSYVSDKNQYQYNGGIVFGIPVNSKSEEFTAKRVGSKSNFLLFKLGASYKYAFTNHIEIRTRLDGQLATSPLISNEQFSAGGASSVRGYYESQIVNDTGIIVSLEFVTPKLMKSVNINDIRAHVFFDYSKTWRKNPLPGEDENSQISGVGLGFRLQGFNGLILEADVANALKQNGEIKKSDTRWHLKLKHEF